MTKSRDHFVVIGYHPALIAVRDHLIRQGYVLISLDDEPNEENVFVLFGAEASNAWSVKQIQDETFRWQFSTRPVLLLSSSSVYSDKSHELVQLPVQPMDEAQGHVVTSPLDPRAFRALTALFAEHAFVQRTGSNTLILRPFNIYGPGPYVPLLGNIIDGVIPTFIEALSQDLPLQVYTPGRQTRTFLHIEDFLACIDIMLPKLLHGQRGIYNVGSDEQVEILSLAKSIGHAFSTNPKIELVESNLRHVWWKYPALDRIKAMGWKPKISLRNGLFRLAREQS